MPNSKYESTNKFRCIHNESNSERMPMQWEWQEKKKLDKTYGEYKRMKYNFNSIIFYGKVDFDVMM